MGNGKKQHLLIKKIKFLCSFCLSTFLLFSFYPLLLGEEDFSVEKEVSLPSEVLETLERLKENPIEINSATYEEILQIPYITPSLALRIVDFRKKGNVFSDKNSLLKIAGFNKPLLNKISPYITLKQKRIKRGPFRYKTIVSCQYPLEDKYDTTPLKISNKLIYSDRGIRLGGAIYRDAYEKSYIDFYTFYGLLQKNGYGFIVGDYAIDIGERLLSGYPGFVFKSSGIVKGRENLIKPYSSGFEDYSLRGSAIQKQWEMFNSALFISYKKEDATIEDGKVKRVIYETGYHRSETEIEKKDRLTERLIGGTVGVEKGNFRVSTTSLFADYSKKIEPAPANYYCFSGNKYGLTGLHTVYSRDNFLLWSEFGYSTFTKGKGFIIGTTSKTKNATISTLYRNYSERFYSPRAFAFCESGVRNEKGFYTYATVRLPRDFYFLCYIDIFMRPFPTYSNSFETKGYEVFSSMNKRLMKSNFYIRYKRKEKNTYRWEDASYRYERHNLRLSMKTEMNKRANFTILWEGELFRVPDISSEEMGNLFSLSFRKEILKTVIRAGLAFYETDSYYSRIYLFLNDIPGSMYTRPFYGKGKNFYLLLKNKIFNNLSLYARFELNSKEEENTKAIKFGMEWR